MTMNFFSSLFSSNIPSATCISSGPQLSQHHHHPLEEHDYGIHHLYICINRGNSIRHTGIAFQSVNQDVNGYQFVSKNMEINKSCNNVAAAGSGSGSADPNSQPTTTSSYLIYDTYGTTCGFRMYDENGWDKDYEFIRIGLIHLNADVIHILNTLDHSWYNFIFNNCRTYVQRTINILYKQHHINKHMIQQTQKLLHDIIKQDYSYIGRIARTCYQTYRGIQHGNGYAALNGSMMIASEIVDVIKDVDDKMKM